MAPPLHKLIQSPEQFAAMVTAFIADCNDKSVAPYKQRFTLAQGIGSNQLHKWGVKYSEPTAHDPTCIIGRAIKGLADANELHQLDRLDKSSSNTNAMFLLKCQHSYVEQQHIKHEHTGNVSIGIATGVPEPTAS